MYGCKPADIPLVVNEKLKKEDGGRLVDASMYRSLVGSLFYLTAAGPDLMFTASLLSRFMSKSSHSHIEVAKRVLRDLIQNAIKDGRLKFADNGKNQMEVDPDPLNIADTNYAEPVEINMIDMAEVEAVKETGTEGYVLVGKQATDGLNNDVPFGISVEGEQVASVEPKATEGLNGKETEATEGLRKKFEEISIADGANLGVNMVDLNQPPPPPEMEEVDRCMKIEQEGMQFGYPKANESLREYL
ncbi:hypothetical protein KIW84_011839 [Lathyrus oleraceus]|uniref:Uncharacterized protein n=1 Tax=Pisum sativum TaxID=3888 RepID=A0A9D5GVQ2_PEA|nr:hypothetical protein KIW84_011839 [Pisum sativum]